MPYDPLHPYLPNGSTLTADHVAYLDRGIQEAEARGLGVVRAVVPSVSALDSLNPAKGEAYLVESTGAVHVWTGDGWSSGVSVKGPEGPVGKEGPRGPAGVDGQGITITGSRPTFGDFPTTGNTTGDAYLANDTGLLHIWDGAAWGPGVQFRGPEGPLGPEGPRGLTGADGPAGPPGVAGLKGDALTLIPHSTIDGVAVTQSTPVDTGWRKVTPAGTVVGNIFLRRKHEEVHMMFHGVSNTTAGTITVYTLPVGFRPQEITGANWRNGPLINDTGTSVRQASYSSGNMRILNMEAGPAYGGHITYITNDAWPTTMPGTAV